MSVGERLDGRLLELSAKLAVVRQPNQSFEEHLHLYRHQPHLTPTQRARTNCTRAQLRLDRILLGISPEADKPVLIVTARALPPRQLLLNGVRDLSEPQLRLGLEEHILSARQSGKELLRRLARCGTEFVQ